MEGPTERLARLKAAQQSGSPELPSRSSPELPSRSSPPKKSAWGQANLTPAHPGAAADVGPAAAVPVQPGRTTRMQVCVRARPHIEGMDGPRGVNPCLLIDERLNALQVVLRAHPPASGVYSWPVDFTRQIPCPADSCLARPLGEGLPAGHSVWTRAVSPPPFASTAVIARGSHGIGHGGSGRRHTCTNVLSRGL